MSKYIHCRKDEEQMLLPSERKHALQFLLEAVSHTADRGFTTRLRSCSCGGFLGHLGRLLQCADEVAVAVDVVHTTWQEHNRGSRD